MDINFVIFLKFLRHKYVLLEQILKNDTFLLIEQRMWEISSSL